MAEAIGTFPGYETNREPTLRVMKKHQQAVDAINPDLVELPLYAAA